MTLKLSDINECEARSNRCSSYQTCQNTYGSYRCIDSVQCGPGFEVDTDGQTCVGMITLENYMSEVFSYA